MNDQPLTWSREAICLRPSSWDLRSIAADLYRRTCRVNFDRPGFCVLHLGRDIDSFALRQVMVDLKREMAAIHESTTGNTLVYLSAARFDQQGTTRPHLDGGPDECFLMLGYEPSAIDSELEIYDYARCAFDRDLTPNEFMVKHNPMFESGHDILRPYKTRVPCFSKTDYWILCINNSCSPYSESQPTWQGTLHAATIASPEESKRRVINSTMIVSVPVGTPDFIDDDQVQEFLSTSAFRRQDGG
ncbi:hypothetical protein BOX17_00810 [Halomonas aestuarii]|uniref:Uncharacterized protein n=1 Tax=Halomonas aestuarii TaxID=1897729 RepID=A0A1J0VC64_9GAMM|nr:hypothetical protein [Halomonas aestuarii]APE29622.1 hypothetical protein BOX17_00810 [Halomonas aestuarii]